MTIDLLDLMAKMKWISWLIQNVSYTPTTYRDTRFVQGGADQQTKVWQGIRRTASPRQSIVLSQMNGTTKLVPLIKDCRHCKSLALKIDRYDLVGRYS